MFEDERQLPVLVYGSGYQYGRVDELPEGSRVFCVRGKLTAKAFGVDEQLACADPAILLPALFPRTVDSIPGNTARIYGWSYGLPREQSWPQKIKLSLSNLYKRVSEVRCSEVYTARAPEGVEEWLKHLWSFERIETASLHAAIVADAYGIPWKCINRSWHFKWNDHFSMLGISKQPKDYILSDRRLLNERMASLIKFRDELVQFVETGGEEDSTQS